MTGRQQQPEPPTRAESDDADPAGALIITVKLGKRSKRRGSMAIV
jgi:hypothetical protein